MLQLVWWGADDQKQRSFRPHVRIRAWQSSFVTLVFFARNNIFFYVSKKALWPRSWLTLQGSTPSDFCDWKYLSIEMRQEVSRAGEQKLLQESTYDASVPPSRTHTVGQHQTSRYLRPHIDTESTEDMKDVRGGYRIHFFPFGSLVYDIVSRCHLKHP